MKKFVVLAFTATIALGVSLTSCNTKGGNVRLSSPVDTAAYAIGVANGEGFRMMLESFPGEELDVDKLLAGLEAALKGNSSSMKMTSAEARDFLNEYVMLAQIKEAEKNQKASEAFLEKNKKEAGVITTESGLQYKVVKEGTGAKPTLEDRVKVHYTGTTMEGKVFDSTSGRKEPAELGLKQVIKGWQEGIQMMSVGSKYIFWIPSNLAYGAQGAGRDIKPNSALKFEVELVDIVKPDANKKK